MLIEHPQSVFEADLNTIVGNNDKDFNALLVIVVSKELHPFFLDLYRHLGFQRFLEVLEIGSYYELDNWPTKSELDVIVLLCVVFILHRKQKKSWPEIRSCLKKYDFKSIKYSLKLNLLDRYIKATIEALKINQNEESEIRQLFKQAVEELDIV